MKKTVLISFFVTLFFCGLNAQGRGGLIRHWSPPSSYSPGFSLSDLFGYGTINGNLPGTMYLSTELGVSLLRGDIYGPLSNKVALGQNNMASIGLLHIFPGNFGYKLSYMYGTYVGSDAGSKLAYRGYAYSTKLSEISLCVVHYLIGGPYSPNSSANSIYFFGGFGVLLSNSDSKGELPNPASIYKHSATTPDIPFGVGYQYEMATNVLIGAEFGEHYALGDYVEGFKPIKGNYASDVLTHFSVTLAFKFYKSSRD